MKKIYIFLFLICSAPIFALKYTITSHIYADPSVGVNLPLPSTMPHNLRKVRIINRIDSMPQLATAIAAAEYIFSDAMQQEYIDLVDVEAEVFLGDNSTYADFEICKVVVEYTDTVFFHDQYVKFWDIPHPYYLGVLFPMAMTNQTRGTPAGIGMHIYLNPSFSYHFDKTQAPDDKYDMITILLRALAIGCGIQSSLNPDNLDFGKSIGDQTFITAFDTQIFNDSAYTFADVVVQNVSAGNFLANHSIYADGLGIVNPVQLFNDWEAGTNGAMNVSGLTLNSIDYNTYTNEELDSGFYDLLDADLRQGVSLRTVTPYTMGLLRKLGWLRTIATGQESPLNGLYNSSLHCSNTTLSPNTSYTLSMSGTAGMSDPVCKLYTNDSSYVIGNMQDYSSYATFSYSSIPQHLQWQRDPITKNIIGQFQATADLYVFNQLYTQRKTLDIQIPFPPNKPIIQKSEITDNGNIQLHLNAFANGSDTYTVTYTGLTYSDVHTFTVSANALDTLLANIPGNQLYNISIYGTNNQGNSNSCNFTFGFSAHPLLNMVIAFNSNYVTYNFNSNGNPIDLSDVTFGSVTISDASTGYVWLTSNAGPLEEISISSLPRGRYIISVVANGDTYSRMFLKR